MSNQNEDKIIKRIITSFKIISGLLFITANGYLIYRLATAHADGTKRAQHLQKIKQSRKKQNKEKVKDKNIVPQQMQPEYIEKQIRKYKQVVAQQKKINKIE